MLSNTVSMRYDIGIGYYSIQSMQNARQSEDDLDKIELKIIQARIEQVRGRLNQLLEENGLLVNDEILTMSVKLDQILNCYENLKKRVSKS